ncbi:hypothetical protein AB0D45_20355 [Streptomyces sp. NPDC048352]|uniref:hypothetical protein n=1 Tax=Streptomyces sp. NPDC048352 TaxID=3154718 RepID=UPI003447D759
MQADMPAGALQDADSGAEGELVAEIQESLAVGEMPSVEMIARCSGAVEGTASEDPVETPFVISVRVSTDFFHVDLATYTDAWMPYDLRGRQHAAVFQANRPRLAAVLKALAETLGVETDPDDPTWFGIPTDVGVDNHFEDDGSPSDRWGRFEIPHRNEVFRLNSTSEPGYRRQASGPVRYVPAIGGHGILGYLWASDEEGAASFEPCEAADLDGYRAGLVWLDRLREAYVQGLSPAAALAQLGAHAGDPVAGRADVGGTAEVEELWQLLELAQG